MPRSPVVGSAQGSRATTSHAALKVGVGSAAIIVWGLFFDALARSGRWVLDTSYSPFLGALHDLRIHYDAALVAYHHGNLYHYGQNAYSNPPFAAYIFLPFHLIGWRATETVWTVGDLVVLAVVLAVVLTRFLSVSAADAWLVSGAGLAAAAVFALYPLHSVLVWGQLGIMLLGLAVVDLFVMPRRTKGVLIGIAAAIKLFPALLIVWFLAKRDVPAAIRVVVAFAVCTVAAAAAWPHGSSKYWLHLLPNGGALTLAVDPTRIAITRATWIFGVGRLPNQSIRGLLGRPPFYWFGTFPWIVVAVVVLAVGVYAAVKLLGQRRELAALFVLMVVTELVSPVSWLHYWVFVALAPFLACVEWRRDRPLAIATIALALSTCADLEDTHLLTASFTSMSPIVLFIVRNCYVLGAIGFLAVATARSRRTDVPALEPMAAL